MKNAVETTAAQPRFATDLVGRHSDIDLRVYWQVLRDRWWVVLGVLAATLAVGLALTLLTTPIFRAAATLQIERDTIKVVNSDAVTPVESSYDREFYQTQYELLRSRSLALRVIQDLKLIEHPHFKTMLGSAGGKPGPEQILAQQQALVGPVLGALSVEPIRSSRLVSVSVDSPDAGLAASIANGYTQAFITSNIEGRFNASSYAKAYLEERLAELKTRLEDSERELVHFADREQIISVGEDEPSLAAQNLAQLNSLLAQAQDARFKAESENRLAAMGSGMGLPQVVDNALIQTMRQSRAQLTSQYQEKLKVYKPDYPEMLQLQSQIREVDRQIATEVQNIRGSVRARFDSASGQEQLLTQRIEALKADVLDLANRSIRYNILKRETATNQELYDGLLQRYKEIGVAGGIGANNISVVDRAEVPGAPYKPSLRRNLMLAFVLGLALGLLATFGMHFLDRRVHTAKALEALTGLPSIGVIPLLPAGSTPAEASANPRSPFSEAYRSVRTALQFSTPHGLPRSLLVSSPGPGEGKTTTAAELARNIAQLGRRVALVDADLRNPSVHKLFGLSNAVGLSSVLAGAGELAAALQPTDVPNLVVVTSGPLPPNPPELLGGDGLVKLLEELSGKFDVVILDGPPVLGLADAPLLSSRAEATLLVVAAEITRKDMVQSALHRFSATRGLVVGTLLTRFDPRNHSEYGYGGYGDYAYGNEPK